jgi:hypothetical protein
MGPAFSLSGRCFTALQGSEPFAEACDLDYVTPTAVGMRIRVLWSS